MTETGQRVVAYFSMEIALDPAMPTYSGGLGVLAGDTLRAAADLEIPMVGVTLLHRKGYFRQRIDKEGWQHEEPVDWPVSEFVKEHPQRVIVEIDNREVHLRAWAFQVRGAGGFCVPVYLLDTDLPENTPEDRAFTHYLYGGDQRHRVCQEAILGIGGVRMLRALGYQDVRRFHMNEGHASFLTLAVLDEHIQGDIAKATDKDVLKEVKKRCVFTTHTPVPAGHDQFPISMVNDVLTSPRISTLVSHFCGNDVCNMTHLALTLSHYVNGVTKRHGRISGEMFAPHVIDAITNGVHAGTWTSAPFQVLFDETITGWRQDNPSLRYALGIPHERIWEAHGQAKRQLLDYVTSTGGVKMDPETLTIGFARRAATYKRADLMFHDVERLRKIGESAGALQVVFAGKAHPKDEAGKQMIQRVIRAASQLGPSVKVAYLENYDWRLGKLITSGVDVWLNNPLPPLEASGTSGMKASLNGVPNLSILDGWWTEGCIEGVTGWAIGGRDYSDADSPERTTNDANLLYEKLERVVIPLYYKNRDDFISIMCNAIALNGSFFNTHRMVQEYVVKAYFR